MKSGLIGMAVFIAACAAPPQETANMETPEEVMSLAGSEWSLDTSDPNTNGVFVKFGPDGRVSGSGGCNTIGGPYEQTGAEIKIGPLFSTRKACPGPIMDIERRVLSALDGAKRINASHLKLDLLDDEGELLLSLKRNDWD